MKTKISLLCGALIALSFLFDGTAFAQMGGYGGGSNSNSNSSKAAANPSNPSAAAGTKKPGERLPDGSTVATVLSKDEAQKKDPPPKSGYPAGDPNYSYSHKPGYLQSPYSRRVFDCSGLPRGSYILDTYANHVFVKP